MRKRTLAAIGILWLGTAYCAVAQQVQVTLDPAQTRIEWTLNATLHTVHGTFKLRSGNISFEPRTGNANGELVVDAASGESGNETRDGKMHKEILETKHYPEITFVVRKVFGQIAAQGNSTVQVQGTLHLHGADHDLNLSVPLRLNGTELKAKASFVVPYQEWGLKNPSTLLLHVSDKVQISVEAVGKLTMAGTMPVAH